LSRNLGASTSWNPKGLSRPVTGLLYLKAVKKNKEQSTAQGLENMVRKGSTVST
jgi:hypothetical protein